MAGGKRLDFTCEMKRRGAPQLAGIGDGIGADGAAGGAPDGNPDVVPVGSAADNNFSLPSAIDAQEGRAVASSASWAANLRMPRA